MVLSQAWAYGHLVYLADKEEARDVAVQPTPRDLSAALGEAEAVALYDAVRSRPELQLPPRRCVLA